MQEVMSALARGDRRPFGDAMAPDFTWTIPGQGAWSGVFRGKEVVQRQLLAPLFAQFGDTYTSQPLRFIAEADYVVVEARGRVTTKRGARYDNVYCNVCRFENGQLKELTEYMDTALAERVLEPPRR
jgi:hypothetical protein